MTQVTTETKEHSKNALYIFLLLEIDHQAQTKFSGKLKKII